MLRGYRVLVAGGLAAFGFVTFGLGWMSGGSLGDSQQERQQSYRYAADQPLIVDPAASSGANAKPFEYRTPCDNPKGREESDLCAQWKAANAAEDSALWTKWGFWIGVIGSALLLWQIILTRRAVEDTSEATEAMREANELTERAQRAWVSLGARPELVRYLGEDRLHLRINFIAQNVGQSPAAHFAFVNEILFHGRDENADVVAAAMEAKIEEWRGDYTRRPRSNLLPNDTEVVSSWKTFGPEQVKWGVYNFIQRATCPVLLSAVFYRTSDDTDTVQLSWRSWYLMSIDERGQLYNRIPLRDEDYGPEELRAETFHLHIAHEEYEAAKEA